MSLAKCKGGIEKSREITPPLKWAGGKRWFAAKYAGILPSSFNVYYEPFFGSGALFFSLRPSRAVASDLNSSLVDFYLALRDKPDLVRRYLVEHAHRHSMDYYYKVRSDAPRSATAKAARFLYLNRTCWNGLYRVNMKGQFNVPKGTKEMVLLPSDDFSEVADLLRTVEFIHSDFEPVMERARKGDFIFVDPPYTVNHNKNGFLKYNEKIFSWQDQVRLKECVVRAVNRGAKVLVTNAHHESIFKLYQEYDLIKASRASVIAGKKSARGYFNEVLIKCY